MNDLLIGSEVKAKVALTEINDSGVKKEDDKTIAG
jgi:hypothetical protein